MRVSEFLISVTFLLGWPTAIVKAKEDGDDKPLFYQQLDYFAPCADGSPAGIYTDFASSGTETRKSHVIDFQGGGGCSSERSCRVISRQKPHSLSSKYEFESITGHTIVSNDPFENPALAEDFAKWVVPYCSQDLWLGAGAETFGFRRAGSLHVDAALRHWLDAVTASNTTSGAVDTLVLSGHSAGTFAILNHMDQIRSIAREAGVKNLRYVLDASMLTDLLTADLEVILSTVDPEVHPLCLENPDKTPYDELVNREELSQLPCCLSIHCMIRHSPSMSAVTSAKSSGDERLLLIDSAYDFLSTVSSIVAEGGIRNAVGGNYEDGSAGMMSLTGFSSSLFSIGESGGNRKARVLETLFAGGRYVGPNVVWAMPSAILHNTLVSSAEIATRLCTREVTEEDAVCESNDSECLFLANPFGIEEVCNATGYGLSLEIFDGLKITQWTNTEAWKRSTINGKSIRDIISDFVLTTGPINGSNSTEQAHATFIFDTCPGPNCVPEGQTSSNPVQSLLEIEDNFVSIPDWVMTMLTIAFFVIVVTYIYMAYATDVKKDDMQQDNMKSKRSRRIQTARSLESEIRLRDICVESNEGSKILENVDLTMTHSTLNCILGKSGSGKSTLLSVLSCQIKSNLNVSLKTASDIKSVPSTFMRQLDHLSFENIKSVDYLHTTSKIYGADSETLEFVLGLIKPFFPVKTKKDENNVEVVLLDPFHDASVKDLSGGQRRMLAIAAALFQNSSLLLLDEPLSGLDSVSSLKVMELLRFIAKENAVTVFMTLHQPSNEILDAMDTIMVLDKGKVVFDSRTDSIQRSSAEFVHELLSDADRAKLRMSDVQKEGDVEEESSLMVSDSSPLVDSNIQKLRLWQVRPIVRRISLEHPMKLQEFIVLPIVFLLAAGWGSIDSASPILAFMLCIGFLIAAVLANQARVVVNWDVLSAHLWDLEDKRISPLSFLIASSLHMFYVPLITIPVSLALAYVLLGWNWAAFLPSFLLMTLATIVWLQIGRTLSAKASHFRVVAALFNVVVLLGCVVSGTLVNPSKVPVGAVWIMYLSPWFWAYAGVLLSVFEHAVELGEQQCQSLAACIVYSPGFMAYATGFSSVTTASTAMYVLIGMALVLALIEYILLCQKVVQRDDYATLADDGEGDVGETAQEDIDETSQEESEETSQDRSLN